MACHVSSIQPKPLSCPLRRDTHGPPFMEMLVWPLGWLLPFEVTGVVSSSLGQSAQGLFSNQGLSTKTP